MQSVDIFDAIKGFNCLYKAAQSPDEVSSGWEREFDERRPTRKSCYLHPSVIACWRRNAACAASVSGRVTWTVHDSAVHVSA
jgi:hypothetical protein